MFVSPAYWNECLRVSEAFAFRNLCRKTGDFGSSFSCPMVGFDCTLKTCLCSTEGTSSVGNVPASVTKSWGSGFGSPSTEATELESRIDSLPTFIGVLTGDFDPTDAISELRPSLPDSFSDLRFSIICEPLTILY